MKLRIKNFRSLADTGDIQISPITILIGRNSSGKSSFLRTFPMLKQSTEERTKSPILLYGNYIDFGSFKDIKPHYNTEKNDGLYELGFTIDNDISELFGRRYSIGVSRRGYYQTKAFEINYGLKFEENDKELVQINEINCSFLNNEIRIKLDHKKQYSSAVIINENNHFRSDENFRFIDEGAFFLQLLKDRKGVDNQAGYETISITIHKKIINLISKYCLKSTNDATKWSIISGIQLTDNNQDLLDKLKAVKTPKKWSEKILGWTTKSEDFLILKDYIVMFDFFNVLGKAINQYLVSTFSGIKYIAPLRATAERYYRIQHLAVDQVDPNGKNLPIFLDSLTETQMVHFQAWTMEHFNFKTKISKIEGHYSIKIVQEDKYEINLSDMGFGYSQILPIITQLWYTASKYDYRRNFNAASFKTKKHIIAIEQPELHLHPEFQAKFADALSKIIKLTKEEETNLSIIIETHSDIIINRLGDCILSGDISHEDINIVIFNKTSENQPSKVTIAKYDEEGNLLNWPLGFFLPSIK